MSESIIVAIVTGGLSLLGVIISNLFSNSKVQQILAQNQAITDVKLENLTEEVKKHNNFAQRVPVLEEQVKVINHRLDDLERK